MSRTVVVSNRVAKVTGRNVASQGGLAVAIVAALRKQGGLWFGWSGEVIEHGSGQVTSVQSGGVTTATVPLIQRDYEEYYNGFANRTLWPLFHLRLDLAEFENRYIASYDRANAYFANHLRPLLRHDDTIWVHDYHFISMAEQLRYAGCRNPIGFFLHVPWPPSVIFRTLPNHERIFRSLCNYDLIGFQTQEDVDTFCEYAVNIAGADIGGDGVIEAYGNHFKVAAFPIGIDTRAFAAFAKNAVDKRLSRSLIRSLGGKRLIIGVDRLDYSKGLVQRFNGYERFLADYPENRGKTVLMQIAPPSRTEVAEYQEIGRQVETVTGHLNGAYSEHDWTPARYINRGYDRRTLSGFYRVAKVGLVTPLKDGMNVVAKEFVAAQSSRDPGVLVLSHFAGAAKELESALLVNPYDAEALAENLQRAITMPLAERKERWTEMFRHLRRNDVSVWWQNYMRALRKTYFARRRTESGTESRAGAGAKKKKRPGAKNPGAKNPGAKNPGAKNPGAKNPGVKNPGARNARARNARSGSARSGSARSGSARLKNARAGKERRR